MVNLVDVPGFGRVSLRCNDFGGSPVELRTLALQRFRGVACGIVKYLDGRGPAWDDEVVRSATVNPSHSLMRRGALLGRSLAHPIVLTKFFLRQLGIMRLPMTYECAACSY